MKKLKNIIRQIKKVGVRAMNHKRELMAGIIAGTVALSSFTHAAFAVGAMTQFSDSTKYPTVVATQMAHPNIAFSDVAGHWAKDAIAKAVADGYVDGYQDGTFQPDKSVSRAEFIKLVIAATEGEKTAGGGNWYDVYLSAAKKAGIYFDGDFQDGNLDKAMTRLELSRAAVRAVGVTNTDMSKWMFLATSEGLVQGVDDAGTLAPEGATTRAQAVTIIGRIKTVLDGGKLPVQQTAVDQAKKLIVDNTKVVGGTVGSIDYKASEDQLAKIKTNIFAMAPQIFGGKVYDGTGRPAIDAWGEKGFVIDTPNFSGQLDKLVLIDLANPSDPNHSMLDWSKLTWNRNTGATLTGSEDAFALVAVTKVDKNSTGASIGFVPFSMAGFIDNRDDYSTGKLTAPKSLFDASTNMYVNALVLPKGGLKTNGALRLAISNLPASKETPIFQVLVEIAAGK